MSIIKKIIFISVFIPIISVANSFAEDLKKYVTFRKEDCFKTKVPANIDILFEDGSHEAGFTAKVLKRFKAKTVIFHDYGHFLVGPIVKKDFDSVLGEPDEIVKIDHQHNCGLAIKYES